MEFHVTIDGWLMNRLGGIWNGPLELRNGLVDVKDEFVWNGSRGIAVMLHDGEPRLDITIGLRLSESEWLATPAFVRLVPMATWLE